MRRNFSAFAQLSVALSFATASFGQGSLQSMRLLTGQVGWAASSRQIFWTTDAGLHWTDITPAMPSPTEKLASIFFLDSLRGWILRVDRDQATGAPQFDLASTASAGAGWSIARLDIPDLDPGRGLSGQAWIDFVDALHGWVMVRMNGNTAVSIGALLATDDGGATWRSPALDPPIAGPIHFVTSKRGWLAGGPYDELYRTDDAGGTWHPVTLLAPPQMYPTAQASYGLPVFEDSNHGFLAVDFSGPDDDTPLLAMFITVDGGRNWKPVAAMPRDESALATTVTDSTWITAVISGQKLSLKTITSGGNVSSPILASNVEKNFSRISRLSFATRSEGWALANGRLLSTLDGGSSWSDITPPKARGAELSAPIQKERQTSLDSYAESRHSSSAASASGASEHLGFDKSLVILTPGMQKWWNESPYWVTNIYLPGAPNRGKDANLTAAWVTAVQNQGWGFIPTWFGRQAPCACATTSCAPFTYTISSNTTTAQEQGISEADSAIKSAATLGLTPNIIYHDIEYYTPSSSCSAAVTAFLDGWDTELHNNGISAGVYGNPVPAQDDFSRVSPLPDDVWIAKYNNEVTIWGLGALKGSLWPNQQRIHQYQQEVESSYGGSATYKIDPDIIDARIINGSASSKKYTFTFTSLDYPGAAATFALNNNNINGSSGSLIDGSGQTGQIVGYYVDSSSKSHGFLYQAGNFSSIDYPGASDTFACGINDGGEIVGHYLDSSGNSHGFLKQAGDFSPIDYTSSPSTYAFGINDAGEVVGSYLDSSGNQEGFLYEAGTFSSIVGCLGATNAGALAINGDGTIVGYYDVSGGNLGGFLYYAGSLSCTENQTFSSINDNAQIADIDGLYQKGSFSTIMYPGATAWAAYGTNEHVQVVGYYADSSGNWHGFLAVP